jgi:hypothetical protein
MAEGSDEQRTVVAVVSSQCEHDSVAIHVGLDEPKLSIIKKLSSATGSALESLSGL